MPIRPDQESDLLTVYLQLAASRGGALVAQELRERIGDRLDALLTFGAVHNGRPLSRIVCRSCFEGHTAIVSYDVDSRRSCIYCPEAGRVVVDDRLLETVQFDPNWLPEQLARALDVKPTPKRRTLVEGVAWWLGDIVVGRTEVSVALAVGIRSSAEIRQLSTDCGGFLRIPAVSF